MSQEGSAKRADFKYKIGKIKHTPPVLKDVRSGLEFIELKKRDDEKVYGVTTFLGNYKEEKKLGQGTFGEVYRGLHLATQRQVAMKKILVKTENDLFPITAQREITILKRLNHRNVVQLIEMVYDYPPAQNGAAYGQDPAQAAASADTMKSFYMILPYMVADLSGILHNPRVTLEMADIKNMMLQIFEGINYIHCKKFMHRDIKTANILLDHKGILKIADFGLARNYYGAPPNLKYPGGAGTDAKYTSVVVTRWYRAPELVLGDKNYTTAVDIWGIGCVFAEFFEKRPILQGKTDIDQGHVIFKLMGTPSDSDWQLARYLPGAELTRTSYEPTYKERFGKFLTEKGLDLLAKLLSLDPYKRLTAMAAMQHPFFSEDPLPKPELSLPCEESHETDIARYGQEMQKTTSNLPPAAPSGHAVEQSQTQRQSSRHHQSQQYQSLPHQKSSQPYPQQTTSAVPAQQPPQPPKETSAHQQQYPTQVSQQNRTTPAPTSLPPKPKPAPPVARYNREAAPQNNPVKPPPRHLGGQYQHNNYGNYYNHWQGGERYYDSYNDGYSRADRYSDDPHYNGYGYRSRGYQRYDMRREGESRYNQRPYAPQQGAAYRPNRRDTYKLVDRTGQPYPPERVTHQEMHPSPVPPAKRTLTNTTQLSSHSSAATGSTAASGSAVSNSSEPIRLSSTASLDNSESSNIPQQKPHPPATNPLEARIYGRDEAQSNPPAGRLYPRSTPDSKNSEGAAPSEGSTDPTKRNIVDYY
ncbi:AaceriABR177Cp [[Ashbya] aceris (nom. inval.)]|nr:AaceriABR177Cp [[Ashbya] aceris (nom. inval.)]